MRKILFSCLVIAAVMFFIPVSAQAATLPKEVEDYYESRMVDTKYTQSKAGYVPYFIYDMGEFVYNNSQFSAEMAYDSWYTYRDVDGNGIKDLIIGGVHLGSGMDCSIIYCAEKNKGKYKYTIHECGAISRIGDGCLEEAMNGMGVHTTSVIKPSYSWEKKLGWCGELFSGAGEEYHWKDKEVSKSKYKKEIKKLKLKGFKTKNVSDLIDRVYEERMADIVYSDYNPDEDKNVKQVILNCENYTEGYKFSSDGKTVYLKNKKTKSYDEYNVEIKYWGIMQGEWIVQESDDEHFDAFVESAYSGEDFGSHYIWIDKRTDTIIGYGVSP